MIYLDNASAMPPAPETADFFRTSVLEDFVNQESLHHAAYLQRQKLLHSAGELCAALSPEGSFTRLIWGNSATELIMLAGRFLSGCRVLSSPLEHPAVTAALTETKTTLLPVPPSGKLSPDALPDVTPEAIFLHHVQSETGIIQDIAAFKRRFPAAMVIADCAQSGGKMALPPVDAAIVSGVKFGAPGGAALLLSPTAVKGTELIKFAASLRERHRLPRIVPPLLHSMAFAAKLTCQYRDAAWEKARNLQQKLLELTAAYGIKPLLPPSTELSPYITPLFLPGYQAAVVVRTLSQSGIHCSSGSACAAESDTPSAALLALGVRKKAAFSLLRVSFNFTTTENEVIFFASELKKVLKNY